jgi:hypothetical protein
MVLIDFVDPEITWLARKNIIDSKKISMWLF